MTAIFRIVFAVIVFLLACPASARSELALAGDLADIRNQQIELRAKAERGSSPFSEMSASDRQEVLSRQTEVLKKIEGKDSLTQLGEKDRLFVFNELEWIRSKVTGAEDDRIICERHRPSGSNRVVRTCATVAERRKARESAVQDLSNRNNCMDLAGCRGN